MPELAAAVRAQGARVFATRPDWPAAGSNRYGPVGTVDSPQYDAAGNPTGRQAGRAARLAEKAARRDAES